MYSTAVVWRSRCCGPSATDICRPAISMRCRMRRCCPQRRKLSYQDVTNPLNRPSPASVNAGVSAQEPLRHMCSPPNLGVDSGSLFPGVEPVGCLPGPPILCIIVDAEEEFHWGRPVSARNHTTTSIRHQRRAHEVFSCYDAKPTYLVTYPIATDPSAAAVLRD